MNKSPVGRPPVEAPEGYMSIRDAATQRGVSYSVVYRFVSAGLVRHRQAENGVIFVDARDVHRIVKHQPPKDRARIPVQLSPTAKRHRAWSAAAHAKQVSVTELAYNLLDKAAGFSE